MRFLAATGLLLPLIAACGGAAAPAPTASAPPQAAADGGPKVAAASPAGDAGSAGAKVDFDALLAREAPAMKSAEARSSDGALTASPEAAAKPTFEPQGKREVLTIPVGTEQPVSCLVRTDFPPPAGLLLSVLQNIQRQIPKNQLSGLDVAVVGKVPYIEAELQYVVEQDGKPVVGMLKAAAFERGDGVVLCWHDEFGYRATFRRVAESVVKTLVVRDAPAPGKPVELQIDIARMGKQPIGYAISRHFIRADGTHVETDSSSMLAPRSPVDFVSRDSTSSTTSDKTGAVTGIDTAMIEEGEPSKSLHVSRTAPGKYHAEGTVSGKPVKGDFVAKTPLWGDWRERSEVRAKLLGGPKAKELVLSCYSTESDPVGATPCAWRATDQAGVFDHTTGDTHLRLTLDETAHMISGTMPMGQAELLIERVLLEDGSK